jgi:2-oxoglutarate ferredoxin oxidoreductase subunit alpha
VVVAYGTPSRYVRAAVRELRAEGKRVGFVRPVSLVPFPQTVIATAAQSAQLVAVYENSTGQMIDDVRLSVLGRCPVEFIGGLTTDTSGFGVGPDLDVAVLRARIEQSALNAGVWS